MHRARQGRAERLNVKALTKALRATFSAPATRKPDSFRAAREEAKRLAAEHAIDIERMRDGGMNVWPPKGRAVDDPFEGDHFACDWGEALRMVRAYAGVQA